MRRSEERFRLLIEGVSEYAIFMLDPNGLVVTWNVGAERIKGYVDDARAKGAEIVEINPAGEDFSQQEHRKIPPTLIINPTDEMKVRL